MCCEILSYLDRFLVIALKSNIIGLNHINAILVALIQYKAKKIFNRKNYDQTIHTLKGIWFNKQSSWFA